MGFRLLLPEHLLSGLVAVVVVLFLAKEELPGMVVRVEVEMEKDLQTVQAAQQIMVEVEVEVGK